MALEQTLENPVTTLVNRTLRGEFQLPLTGEGNVLAWRENVPLDASGNQVGTTRQVGFPTTRTLTQFLAEPDISITRPSDGTAQTVKTEDILTALRTLFDMWVQDDQDAATPTMPPQPPQPQPVTPFPEPITHPPHHTKAT